MNEDQILLTERVPDPQEQVFGSGLPEDLLLSSMNIYVSDDLSLDLEAATKESGEVDLRHFESLSQQGVVKMRRLFPHAGEFEERTRREGLHRAFISGMCSLMRRGIQ